MFNFAISIANLTQETCTQAEIIRIFSMNRFFLSKYDEKIGYATSFFEDENYITLQETPLDLSKEIADAIEKETGIKSTINYIMPKDADYQKKLWDIVNSVQLKIIKWLDFSIERQAVSTELIKKFLEVYPCKLYLRSETNNSYQPNIDVLYNTNCLSSAIISRDFISPLFQGNGDAFARLRKCPSCNNYFYALDTRKQFCGMKCRNAIMYQRDRERGKR